MKTNAVAPGWQVSLAWSAFWSAGLAIFGLIVWFLLFSEEASAWSAISFVAIQAIAALAGVVWNLRRARAKGRWRAALDRYEEPSASKKRIVILGGGFGGVATARYLVRLGVRRENVILTDDQGVIHRGRDLPAHLGEFAIGHGPRTLAQAMTGADVFVGLSAPHVLTRDMLLDLLRARQAGPFDRAIDVASSRLRRKLEDGGRNAQLIKTVRGGGYVLAADVERG